MGNAKTKEQTDNSRVPSGHTHYAMCVAIAPADTRAVSTYTFRRLTRAILTLRDLLTTKPGMET